MIRVNQTKRYRLSVDLLFEVAGIRLVAKLGQMGYTKRIKGGP